MNPKQLIKENYIISYNTYGDNKDDCIVFIHPAFMDNTCFYKQVDYFSKDNFVITIDLIGHGLSCVKHTNVQLDASTDHILEILEIEDIQSAHFVGASLGSLIIQHFAYLNPLKVKTLTVVGGYNIHKDNSKILKAQSKEQFKWIFMIIFAMKKFRKYISTVSVFKESEREIVYRSTKGFTRSSFRLMQGIGKIFIRLDKLSTKPILLICGDHDLDLAKEALGSWHKSAPNSKYHIISDAGHCANMDNENAFNTLVSDFIKSNK